MGVRDERLAGIEEANEIEDAEYANLSRKQRRRVLEEQMGKKEVARQVADGMLSFGRSTVKAAQGLHVKSDEVKRLHGGGNGDRIKDYNDPSKW